MKTLLYKRTHSDDPDELGRFGSYGCMGSVRSWDFEAVIGVGGQGKEAQQWNIDRKLTWIGIGPQSVGTHDDGHPILAFAHFKYWGEEGDELESVAPVLAERMHVQKPRTVMTFTPAEALEIQELLALAHHALPSKAFQKADAVRRSGNLQPRCAFKVSRKHC